MSNIISQRQPGIGGVIGATQPAPEYIANQNGTDTSIFDAGNAANFPKQAPAPKPNPVPTPRPQPRPIGPRYGGNGRYFTY